MAITTVVMAVIKSSVDRPPLRHSHTVPTVANTTVAIRVRPLAGRAASRVMKKA
jgi:hypothetical protein